VGRARIAQVPVVVNPTTIWSWLRLNIFYQYDTLLFAWNSWKYYYSRIAKFFIFFYCILEFFPKNFSNFDQGEVYNIMW
jgi:hypothetical protein